MITRQRFRRHVLREVLRAVKSMKEDAMDLGAMAHVLYLLTRGRDYEPFLLENRETGLQLGRSKKYRRLGSLGATGSYNRRAAPWEV